MSKADVTPNKETQEAAPTTQEAAPKRARVAGGKFRANDPATPDINEAWETPHSKSKAKAATTATELAAHEAASSVADSSNQKDAVYYVSAQPEKVSFAIKVAGEDYSPSWDTARKHLVWRIPKEVSDRFETHYHFVSGRVIRSKEV